MPTESFIQLPPDSTGKTIRTQTQTISGTSVHNQVVMHGTNPTYFAYFKEVVAASGGTMFSVWHTSGSPVIRVRGIYMSNVDPAITSGQSIQFEGVKPSASPTGGTAVSATPSDPVDPNSGVAMVLMSRPTNVFSGTNVYFNWVSDTGGFSGGAWSSGTSMRLPANMIQQATNILPTGLEYREITLRSGHGFAFQQKVSGTGYTQVTSGRFGFSVVYTVEY